MKFLAIPVSVFVVFGMVGAGSASACEWMKHQVNASAAPVSDEVAAPATAVDPVRVAKLEKAAILPSTPTEEATEDTTAE